MSEPLSQAEIEALMSTLVPAESTATATPPITGDELLEFTALQQQLLDSASNSASEIVGKAITFENPLALSVSAPELGAAFTEPIVSIQFEFSTLPELTQIVLIPKETALALAEFVTGKAPTDLNEPTLAELLPALESIAQGLCIGASERKNELIGANNLKVQFIEFVLPSNLQAGEVIRTQVALKGEELDGTAILLAGPETAAYLLGKVPVSAAEPEGIPFTSANTAAPAWAMVGGVSENVERLLDVPLNLEVELAKVKMLFKDVAELGTGSIVEMNTTAGELVNILVDGALVARGEVVVVDECFGVRITEILNPEDRLKRLVTSS